jgi:hypothetical protein
MKLQHALIGIAAVGGIALASGTASAQPNARPASRSHVSNIDEVRCLCGGYGFHGRPQHSHRWAYGAWEQRYPEGERYMSPAQQAAEEGGR